MRRREFLRRVSSAAAAMPASAHLLAGNVAPAAEPAAKIKMGQIGSEHGHAAGKMATMRKLSDHYEVVGIVEADAERREAIKDRPEYQGLHWLNEEKLLGTDGLKAVAVETAVRDLVPTAARCIAARKHVHLDKPAGESLAEFRALLAEATRQKRVIQMGYMLRYNPAFQFMFQAARAGWLGEIFEIHGVMSKTVDSAGRQHLAQYRGGSMFELGCHMIDALVALMGKPDRVTPYVRRTRSNQDDLADNQIAVFEYPQATATIRSALVEVDGFRRRQFVVCGNRGTIEILPIEPPRLLLTLAQSQGPYAKGTHEVPLQPLAGRYDGDFLDLAQIIRGEKEPDYGPTHDLMVHEAVLSASGVPVQ